MLALKKNVGKGLRTEFWGTALWRWGYEEDPGNKTMKK